MKNNKNTSVSLLQYQGNQIAFEEVDGKMMVNATQMAKPFGQKPNFWLKTQQSKDLLKAMTVVRKINTADLVVVRNGGIPELQGTWLHEDVALLFAQWLSPEFYIACNDKLKDLLKNQALIIEPKHGVYPIIDEGIYIYPYSDALKAFGASTKSSASKRKARHPQHFKVKFGRNFITGHYFDLLKSYYDYKNGCVQLKLSM